jgi:ribA/ribD-fused uncharacterized protein
LLISYFQALQFGTASIDAAEATKGKYLWATEFENVHSTWHFQEPGFLVQIGDRQMHFAGPEQLYQLLKVGDVGSPDFIALAHEFASLTPERAFSRGRSVPLRADWHSGAQDAAMLLALRHKFRGDPGLAALLLSTRPHPLVSVKPDSYWGIGLDGAGRNRLGELLLSVRDELFELQRTGQPLQPLVPP